MWSHFGIRYELARELQCPNRNGLMKNSPIPGSYGSVFAWNVDNGVRGRSNPVRKSIRQTFFKESYDGCSEQWSGNQ